MNKTDIFSTLMEFSFWWGKTENKKVSRNLSDEDKYYGEKIKGQGGLSVLGVWEDAI